MKWIEIEHTAGVARINIERCDRMSKSSSTQITFWFGAATLVLSFVDSATTDSIDKTLNKFTTPTSINKLTY